MVQRFLTIPCFSALALLKVLLLGIKDWDSESLRVLLFLTDNFFLVLVGVLLGVVGTSVLSVDEWLCSCSRGLGSCCEEIYQNFFSDIKKLLNPTARSFCINKLNIVYETSMRQRLVLSVYCRSVLKLSFDKFPWNLMNMLLWPHISQPRHPQMFLPQLSRIFQHSRILVPNFPLFHELCHVRDSL